MAHALPIPDTPNSISPEWLTVVLRSAGAIGSSRVVSLEVTPMCAGFVGQAARVGIEYDAREEGAPPSIFVKLSSVDPGVREKFRDLGLYRTEVGFYQEVTRDSALPIRVPRPFLSAYDAETGKSVVALEDLAGCRFGDNLAGCSLADARTVVRAMARVHAYYWDSPRLERFGWLRSVAEDATSKGSLYSAMLPRLEERYSKFLTPTFLKAAKSFDALYAVCTRSWSRGPQTLSHGDCRADNFAFDADGELTVFDWQVALRSSGSRDLAYFLATSLPVAQRRETETSLVELYYETLLEGGVRRYSREDLARGIRSGMGSPLSVWVIAGGLLDFSSERGSELLREAMGRLEAALEDYRFAEYLEELAVEKHESYSGGYAPLILQALAKREAVRDAAFFVTHLTPDMRVLDCGCGPGGISLGLAELVPQGEVVGIDVEDAQLEIGRREAKARGIGNIRFEHASVYKLPFEDGSFDAVLAHAVLYHLGEPEKALQELRRVLKPGGVVGLRDADISGDVHHPGHPLIDALWKLAERVIAHNGGDVRFGRRQRQVLRDAGFVNVVGSASCDTFGTAESTVGFSKYWTDVFFTQHRDTVVQQGWATGAELDAMREALLDWGRDPDAFYSRLRCEAVGRKPAT